MVSCRMVVVGGGRFGEVICKALAGAGVESLVVDQEGVLPKIRESEPSKVLLVDLALPLRFGRVFVPRAGEGVSPPAIVMGPKLDVPRYVFELEAEGYTPEPGDVYDLLKDMGRFLAGKSQD